MSGRATWIFRAAAALLMLLCGLRESFAAVNISLPLEGHYRPGRYMPVRVATTQAGTIVLQGTGTMPTQIDLPQGGEAIVPWLAISESPGQGRWSIGGAPSNTIDVPLRALHDDERLVATANSDAGAASSLFPGMKIVAVALDLSGPLLQPPQAWESLDAVVLSEAAAARVTESQRQLLTAAGVALMVQSSKPPDSHWPWRHSGGYWVLKFAPAGPTSTVEPLAYAPTYEWERGWPAPFRWAVVLAGLLFCILAAAAILWRHRYAIFVFIGVCAALAGAFAFWYSRQPTVLQLTAGVMMRADSEAQVDLWTWQSPIRNTRSSFTAAGMTRPVFATVRQQDDSQVRLLCQSDGSPNCFTWQLQPGQTLAFLTRLVRPPPQVQMAPASAILERFADQLYTRAGDRIAGQFTASNPYTQTDIPIVAIWRPQAPSQ